MALWRATDTINTRNSKTVHIGLRSPRLQARAQSQAPRLARLMGGGQPGERRGGAKGAAARRSGGKPARVGPSPAFVILELRPRVPGEFQPQPLKPLHPALHTHEVLEPAGVDRGDGRRNRYANGRPDLGGVAKSAGGFGRCPPLPCGGVPVVECHGAIRADLSLSLGVVEKQRRPRQSPHLGDLRAADVGVEPQSSSRDVHGPQHHRAAPGSPVHASGGCSESVERIRRPGEAVG